MITTLAICALALQRGSVDPVDFSFAFFGCNRLDAKDWDPKANPSSANTNQLGQNFADIANLSPRPKLVFILGDLVIGYADDKGEALAAQLEAWIKEFRRSPLSGKVEFVPVTGNHELNRKQNGVKLPSPYTAAVWQSWLKKNRLAPYSGQKVGHVSDRGLSFSFERHGLHFAIMNTDFTDGSGQVGRLPLHWALEDLAETKKPTFFLGHRNLVDPASAKGDAPAEAEQSKRLIDEMASRGNVLGYLCAHVHAWDTSRMKDNGPWQVIAGNGGSPLEASWKPAIPSFGFALIQIRRSGRVELVPYQRPAEGPLGPASAQPPVELGNLNQLKRRLASS